MCERAQAQAPIRIWNAQFPYSSPPPQLDSSVGVAAAERIEGGGVTTKYIYVGGTIKNTSSDSVFCVLRYPFGHTTVGNQTPNATVFWPSGPRASALRSMTAMALWPPTSTPVLPPSVFRVYVCGVVPNGSGAPVWTVGAFDENLNPTPVWIRSSATSDPTAVPVAIAVSDDGTTVVVAGNIGTGPNHDYYLEAYNSANGALFWTKQSGNADDDVLVGMGLTFDRVFAVGKGILYEPPGSPKSKIVTRAYRLGDGVEAESFVTAIAGDGKPYQPVAIAVSGNAAGTAPGVVAITGTVGQSGGGDTPAYRDYFTAAYDFQYNTPNIPLTWSDAFFAPGDDYTTAIAAVGAVSPETAATSNAATQPPEDQGFTYVWVTGRSDLNSVYGQGPDIVTIQYNHPSGTKDWVARWDGPVHGADGGLSMSVEQHPSGSWPIEVYVSGSTAGTFAGGNNDYVTVKYDTVPDLLFYHKSQVWSPSDPNYQNIFYRGPAGGNDVPVMVRAQQFDGFRYFFVTGASYGGTGSLDDVLTIHNYDP